MAEQQKERRVEPRVVVKLEAKVIFTPLSKALGNGLTLVGATHDMSVTGVGLLISARNIDRYLTGDRFRVQVEIMLPSGAVKFGASHIHHKRLTVGKDSVGYFIGAEITNMTPADRGRLTEYIKSHTPQK